MKVILPALKLPEISLGLLRIFQASQRTLLDDKSLRLIILELQNDLKVIPPAIPVRRPSKVPTPVMSPRSAGSETNDADLFDAECFNLINEYFYGVRIFPGQDPTHVYLGWVTTQCHFQDSLFDQSKDRKVTITRLDDNERPVERYLSVQSSKLQIFF